jgi:protein gp37
MAFWEPWRGCHYCFVFQGDGKRGVDTNNIVQLPNFHAPIAKAKEEYKIKSGSTIYTCFHSDFFLADADKWRAECWQMMKERGDCHFVILTKRIERFDECKPADWATGYPNVTIGVSVENQAMADKRLSIFKDLPIVHKNVICQPMLAPIDLSQYLEGVELVMAGGEYHKNGRELDYDWVLDLREQCIQAKVEFQFRQCASNFRKDGKLYRLSYRQLFQEAKKAEINWKNVE